MPFWYRPGRPRVGVIESRRYHLISTCACRRIANLSWALLPLSSGLSGRAGLCAASLGESICSHVVANARRLCQQLWDTGEVSALGNSGYGNVPYRAERRILAGRLLHCNVAQTVLVKQLSARPTLIAQACCSTLVGTRRGGTGLSGHRDSVLGEFPGRPLPVTPISPESFYGCNRNDEYHIIQR